MKVNNRGRLVLMSVLQDQRRLAEQDSQAVHGPTHHVSGRQQRGRHRLRIAQAQAGLVPIDLAGWLEREPTNSERVLFHREYLRLEDSGLIERCNLHGGRRTTHLRLTAAGRELAEDLLQGLDDEHEVEGGDALIDLDTVVFLPIEMPR
jgi:hypothetical protein